ATTVSGAKKRGTEMTDSQGNRVLRMGVYGLTISAACLVMFCGQATTFAQNPKLEEKLMAVREKQQANKEKLSHYTWTETETISIKGEVKDVKTYQVQMGPDGKPQKTELSDQKAEQGGGRQGRFKQRIVEKKKEEFQEYGQQIAALAKQYT